MKSKNRFCQLFICLIATFGMGCEDRRMNNMIEDKVYLSNYGENIQNIFKWDNSTYSLQVVKSGSGKQGGEVTLSVEESALTPYVSKYTLLPAALYKIKASQIVLNKDDYSASFEIEFNTAGIEALQEDTKLRYAVPFKLSSATLIPGVEDALYSIVVPNILNPYLEFKTAGLAPSTASISTANSPAETRFYAFVQTNYHNNDNLEYKVEVDEAVLTAYNLEKKTSHKLLPAEAYKIDAASMIVANLNNEQALSYYLIKGKVPNGAYMLPIKITSVSKHGINPAKSSMLIPVKIQD
jgi:hypothetical protein